MIYDRNPDARPQFTPASFVPGDVMDVAGCGAGCLLIHRRVLTSIATAENGPEWFTRVTGDDGRVFGEDLSFCLRATTAGFTLTADTGARAGHVKPVILGLPGTGLDPATSLLPLPAVPAGQDRFA
jgi:hypothetical protein